MTTTTEALDRAFVDLLTVAARLDATARADLEAACYPTPTAGSVRSSSPTSPTEAGMARAAHAQTYNAAVKALRTAHDMLNRQLAGAHYTGRPCSTAVQHDGTTVACQAEATHGDLCWRCSEFIRRHHDLPDGLLLAEWNRQLSKPCRCPSDCCPDGCMDLVPHGQGTTSARCRKRQSRSNSAA